MPKEVNSQCYEIIEIEVLSEEKTSNFLQNKKLNQSSKRVNLDFLEFPLEDVAENEERLANTNWEAPNVPSFKNELAKSAGSKTNERTCAANCRFECTKNISEIERKRIRDNFCKLSAQQKKIFYRNFVRPLRENEGTKDTSFQYYLPAFDGTIQICKWYFLSTLDVTDRKVMHHLNQHCERKLELSESDVQEIKHHICSSIVDDQLTAAKMYNLYREKSKNPVDIETYKRIFNKLCEKINSTALALETQLELEEEKNLETMEIVNFEETSNSSTPTANSTKAGDFQRIFEAHALDTKMDIEETQILDFENCVDESELFDVDETIAQSCWNISKQPTPRRHEQCDQALGKETCDRLKSEVDLPYKSCRFFKDVKADKSKMEYERLTDVPGQILDERSSHKIKQRPRHPELWQQNVRKELCQKGLPYFDRFGVQHAGRSVGRACNLSCKFGCTIDFPNEARQRIHKNFWNLSPHEKRTFYAKYVQKVDIKRRSKKCKDQEAPRKKNSFRYFLPMADNTIRVCKFFFLQTLAVSEARIHYYFDTYHNNDARKAFTIFPGRGRKSLLQTRLDAAREHVSSFPADNMPSASKMYELYRATVENPVGIDAYRRIRIQALKANVNNYELTNKENSQSLVGSTENENISESYCSSVSPALEKTYSPEAEEIDISFGEHIFSDANNASITETEFTEYDDDFSEEIVPHEMTECGIKRLRHPELWQQAVRVRRRQKGLSYIDRNGVERAAKTIGPACISTCSYLCTKHFSKQERERIHTHFWNLSAEEKRSFFETYVEKVHIKRRSKQCRTQVEPKRNRSFRYYLPLADKSIRVCQFYFLKTLNISDAKVHYYFRKYHKDDKVEDTRPRRGRKSISQSRMQEVEDHVKSFPAGKRLSAARMYKLYKETTNNPVGIDLYRRVKQTVLEESKKGFDILEITESSTTVQSSSTHENDPLCMEKNQPTMNRGVKQPDRHLKSKQGKSITDSSKGVEKKEKVLGPPCDENCRHACTKKITKNERKCIHAEFWELSKEEQHNFYEKYIESVNFKQRSKGCELESRKKEAFSYNLPAGGETVKVCRKYFLSTLAVSEKRLYYYLKGQNKYN